jgi:DNA-binding MarR family transcriptional regulator
MPGWGVIPGPRGVDDDDATAAELEVALRPLLDTTLGAAEELEDRIAPAHLRALQVLGTTGPTQVSTLAEATGMLPSTASRLSDRLAAAGLVERAPSPSNRRATLLSLTRAGHDVLAELAGLRVRRLQRILAAMDPADRDALLRGARAYAAASDHDRQDDRHGR